MNQTIRTLYPVKDASQAKAIFDVLLGTKPYVDSAYYVGYKVQGNEFGLVPGGHGQGITGPVTYVTVADIRAQVAALVAVGATLVQEVNDVGGGRLVATVQDADGNVLGVLQDA